MNNNTITASRMGSLLRCPRAHYWQYEVGLTKDADGIALRVGSAWHRAMEAWNKGYNPEECLAFACDPAHNLDEYVVATITGLFRGYHARWGEDRVVAEVIPEIQFRYWLDGEFEVAGVVDGLGCTSDSRSVLVESKTSGCSVMEHSKFWLRLRFNQQIYQYVLAARKHGWDISLVIYDVTRKPCIKPKTIPDTDHEGLKIVVDHNGQRVFKKDGTPRESASEKDGFRLLTRMETPEEFGERLASDCVNRPDFYFARKEVPILDGDLDSFTIQRLALGRMIKHFRDCEQKYGIESAEDAWPRAVSEMNCNFCAFQSFCLQNSRIDPEHPPEGFSIKPFNPELERNHDIDSTQEDNADTAQ